MDGVTPDDLSRMIFFEQAKDQAEQEVAKNPRDVSALTRWGGALLELSHFRQGHDAAFMMDEVDTELCLGIWPLLLIVLVILHAALLQNPAAFLLARE